MKVTPRSEVDAMRASRTGDPLKDGWYPARIPEAVDKRSRKDQPMIELTLIVGFGDDDRQLRDWLTNNAAGALKLRHCADAVGALAKYETGNVDVSDYQGHDVDAKLVTEKRGNFKRNVIVDYAKSGSQVKGNGG